MQEQSIGEVRPAHATKLAESPGPLRRRRVLTELAEASAARRAAQEAHPAAVDAASAASAIEEVESVSPTSPFPPSQQSDAQLLSGLVAHQSRTALQAPRPCDAAAARRTPRWGAPRRR